MTFWAHSDPSGLSPDAPGNKWQPLAEHLLNVSRLARSLAEMAAPNDAHFHDLASWCGLLHDFGKYTDCFQQMITISFMDEQVRWLYALELPFFVASVDRVAGSVKLYCAHRLSDALITNHDRTTLTIFLDNDKTGDELVASDDPEVHSGPPILEWSLETLVNDPQFRTMFYGVAKQHITLAKSALATRDIGWVEYVAWRTNGRPKHVGWKTHHAAENLEMAADKMAAYFFVWQQEILRTGNWEAARDFFSLLEKTKQIVDSGVLSALHVPPSSGDE
jgi:HD domain.